MGPKQRREREKEIVRQQILDAARELFVEEGYENVSMRRIADKIEYSPTTIYLYFKDKADLLFNICEETFAKLVGGMEAIPHECNDPIVCLRRGIRAYIDFGLQYPNHYRVTFINHPKHDEAPEHYMRDSSMGMKAFAHLRSGVEDCVKQNLFRETDVEKISQALWATGHGITALLITKPRFPWVDKEELINLMLDMCIEGLKA